MFVAFLGAEGLSISTIESYLAALRYFRLRSDPANLFPSLHTPHLKLILRGIARVGTKARAPLVRLPITSSLMMKIKSSLSTSPKDYDNIMLWAACSMGFFGFLRCGEFLLPDSTIYDPTLHLSLADIRLFQASPQWRFDVLIKGSKTDQLRTGTLIVLGATGAELCPVAALLDYLIIRGSTPGPLFHHPDGQPLRRQWFVTKVQQALSAAGVQGSCFNGHSFRIGVASSASAAAVPETVIKALGRWQSSAYQGYIRPTPEELARVATQLAPSSVDPLQVG